MLEPLRESQPKNFKQNLPEVEMQKLRILFLTDNFPPERNAAATRISERARYWLAAGHSVTVLTSHPNFPEGRVFKGYKNSWRSEENWNGIRVVRVKTFIAPNKGFGLRVFDFLSYMVTSFIFGLSVGPHDVVVANSPQFFCAVSGWALAKIKGLPFVFELADLWPASISAVGAMKKGFLLSQVEKLELFLYRQSARVIALTKSFKTDLTSRGIPAEKIDVIPNGVELDTYCRQAKSEKILAQYQLQDKFVVGYIGTLGMAHALENLIESAKLLANTSNSVHLLIVGTGAMESKLRDLTAQYKLGNVTITGAQPKESMPEFWSVCDLALIHLKDTPLFEGVIPSKMFEAMGMGLPLLMASPKGEATEILERHACGFWVPPEDPKKLADELLRLSKNPSAVKEAADRSEAAAQLHTRKKQADDFIESLKAATV